MYRIRIGDYRVIYTVDQQTITIEILKIGHRKDVDD
ncbi:type II toxin-antitoxin system RelE family toxin [Terrimonas alba]